MPLHNESIEFVPSPGEHRPVDPSPIVPAPMMETCGVIEYAVLRHPTVELSTLSAGRPVGNPMECPAGALLGEAAGGVVAEPATGDPARELVGLVEHIAALMNAILDEDDLLGDDDDEDDFTIGDDDEEDQTDSLVDDEEDDDFEWEDEDDDTLEDDDEDDDDDFLSDEDEEDEEDDEAYFFGEDED